MFAMRLPSSVSLPRKPRENMQDTPLKTSSLASTDEARAAVWTGHPRRRQAPRKRAPPPPRQRPTVVQLRQGTSETPVYFIGAGLYELNTAQMMPPQHSIFAAEIAWPASGMTPRPETTPTPRPMLEDMVVPYVAALRSHAGSTPCVIVGYRSMPRWRSRSRTSPWTRAAKLIW